MIIVSLDNSSKLCTLPIPEGPDLIGVGGVGLVGEYSDLTGLPYSESWKKGNGSVEKYFVEKNRENEAVLWCLNIDRFIFTKKIAQKYFK